jgi:hypothetical protein
MRSRIPFETDAENDYFGRATEPGQLVADRVVVILVIPVVTPEVAIVPASSRLQ